MGESSNPRMTEALASAVTRLGHLRQEIKNLETEEQVLREQILEATDGWPRDAFPVRVGAFELRIGERRGRIDGETALAVLEGERLTQALPHLPVIRDAHEVEALRRALARLAMPSDTRSELLRLMKAAIEWQPTLSYEALTALREDGRLDDRHYRLCFKDEKPVIRLVTVR
ncbi:MAG: hypothetical protein OWU33_00565 [Firmicutes bacterium]|nr:hypothetical protein [Bacillota bacterium]